MDPLLRLTCWHNAKIKTDHTPIACKQCFVKNRGDNVIININHPMHAGSHGRVGEYIKYDERGVEGKWHPTDNINGVCVYSLDPGSLFPIVKKNILTY